MRSRLYIIIGMGMKNPICRDTLAATAREAKILAVNNVLRGSPREDIDWHRLSSWGYRCVPITVSYNITRKK